MDELEPILSTEEFESTPEGVRGFYKEREDGSFQLKVRPKAGWDLQDIESLTKTLSKERAKAKEVSKKLSSYGEWTPETIAEKMQRLEELESMDVNVEVDKKVESRIKSSLETQKSAFQKQLEAKEEMIKKSQAKLQKVLIDGELKSSLVAAGVEEDHVDVLTSYVRNMVNLEPTDDGDYRTVIRDADGDVRYNADAKLFSIKDLVSEMKAKEKFSPFFAGRNKRGGGMPADSQGGKPSVNLSNKDPKEMSRKEKMAFWANQQKN